MPLSKKLVSLGDLYVAYRKAKAEAYYEITHFHALAFTEYEQKLHLNLVRLHRRLIDPKASWSGDLGFIGDYAYLPKSINTMTWEDGKEGHFRALDPLKDWSRRYEKSRTRADAMLRLIIRPTVDFQVVSALWIIKVGHLFDGAINSRLSFGNRLRRQNVGGQGFLAKLSPLNLTTAGLFNPYFSAYRKWRENGLSSMQTALEEGKSILAITMDIEQFYHRVAPTFLLKKRFLDVVGVNLTSIEESFTTSFLKAITTWYESTPDYVKRPLGGLPVGLSASKIIANVLLAHFDNALVEQISPIYYGRYVDDIFLVFENVDQLRDAKQVTRWLANKLTPLLTVPREESSTPSLALKLPYARDSELIFRGAKQKIFSLSSLHGLDLIEHIREQIRIQSSEYRLLPSVPVTGAEMASKALLAAPDATLQADALRKADVVSVRRLGLSLLLRDIEVYSADLQPNSWKHTRTEFYGLVERHVLTPYGFFEFSGYLARVFGLMLSCHDLDEAEKFIEQFKKLVKLLKRTSTLGRLDQRSEFRLCVNHYAAALKQTALQAATEKTARPDVRFLSVLRGLSEIDPEIRLPNTLYSLRMQVRRILLADWGRRPYKDFWFLDQRTNENGPPVPKELEVKRKIRLGGIRRFRRLSTNLKVPHWPALAFPTRPLKFDEISLVAPQVLGDPNLFRQMIMVLRGARVASPQPFGLGGSPPPPNGPTRFFVPDRNRKDVVLAITSYGTSNLQWEKAARGNSDRSAVRFTKLNFLINRILQEKTRPDYILFPELSIPRRWALRIARKLAMTGVSLLAGIEYYFDRATQTLRNDCLISLTTNWPGYPSHMVRMQPKFAPAHGEKAALKKLNLGSRRFFFKPSGSLSYPSLYTHKGFYFSVLLCSDLTNIAHRNTLRGEIDALFVLEWNRDVRTFSSLVEATANDLHAFVAQVNNRDFGDSRVRSPTSKEYLRDIIQVKGGCSDFYVLGEIDYDSLREEQRSRKPKHFKPTPIGYKMSGARAK